MKTTTKHFFIALTCTLVLSPSLIKADRGNTAGGGILISTSEKYSTSTESSISFTNLGSSIITNFNVNLGNVIVDLIDENGFVAYSQSVNTSSVSQFTINTADFVSGSFVIIITNAQGGVVVEEAF